MTLTNGTVSGNTASGYGGGTDNSGEDSIAILTNVTLSSNTAGFWGGGMFNTSGSTISYSLV